MTAGLGNSPLEVAIDSNRLEAASDVCRSGLSVHFFTIVLNGEPFIRYHMERFLTLPFHWHWHVVEGVASLTRDTAWSVANGGRIPEELHRGGLSCDGTTEYLDELARRYPDRITVYRKVGGFWDGKLEMVQAPLASLTDECLLWQVDADELWTPAQICRVRELFLAAPRKSAAYFYCNFFVGERLLLTTRGAYGNDPLFEWLRCWRYLPGDRWVSHEPPRLSRSTADGSSRDVAAIDPFRHALTEAHGLCFQHFAYVTAEQLRFKEVYYGYWGAVERWEVLQSEKIFPQPLRRHFSWVKDGAKVDTVLSQRVKPLAFRDSIGKWRFLDPADAALLPELGPVAITLRRVRLGGTNLLLRLRKRGSNFLRMVAAGLAGRLGWG